MNNNLNLKNKKVIILTYQTYHYDFYQNISNDLDQLIKDNLDLDNKFDLIHNFLTNKNISFFVGYLDDSKDQWFLKDLYDNSYYQKILTFDENDKLIDNKIFYKLIDNLQNQIDQEIESLEVNNND